MELEYRFAAADDIENLVQIRLEMLRVVNDLGPNYVFDNDFVRSNREYFLNGDQISVLAGVPPSASLRSCRLLPIRQGSALTL